MHPWTLWLGRLTLATIGLSSTAMAQTDPGYAPPEIPGVEVLNRGPVHEAFAEPLVFDPRPGPILPKAPYQQVEELPPDQKPEGANVQWIPGYWSWDDERNDYLWVSGIWRDIPPGRQWVPGYWSQVQGGYQWTPGAWVATDQAQVEYLPEPPQSLEVGPNGPSPSADASWAPGCWYWQETRYVWRPGYWVPFQPNWLWVPAHYICTPNGYIYVNGYWDHPFMTRGLAFAPVYFQQPVYAQTNFVYTPTVGLLATALASSLFVRPAYQQYCFGDYYAANNFKSGIYPWYSYHQSRHGYDPLFSHYAAVNTRRDPRWVDGLHEEYRYRRDHPEARPARTFVQQQTIVNNITNVNVRNVTKVQNLVIGRPLNQLASRGAGPAAKNGPGVSQAMRFERIDDARRKSMAQQGAQLNQFRQQRIRQEQEFANRSGPNPQEKGAQRRGSFPDQARRVDLPRSPVASSSIQDRDDRPREAMKAVREARENRLENATREAQAGRAAKAAREAQAANGMREAQAERAAKAAREAQSANQARQANAAAKAAREAQSANQAREAQANRAAQAAREAQSANQARQANAAAKAAREAQSANQAREAQANRAAQAAREAQSANQARQANAAAKAAQNANRAQAVQAAKAAREANVNARQNDFRGAMPPPVPRQPNLDPSRRPADPGSFRQQRHEPDPDRVPPQFRNRPQPDNKANDRPGNNEAAKAAARQLIQTRKQQRNEDATKGQNKKQRD